MKRSLILTMFFFFAAFAVSGCTNATAPTAVYADSISVMSNGMSVQDSTPISSTTMEGKALTIIGSKYPVKIIKGEGYVFPKNLGSYGMQLVTTSSGHTLMDTTKRKSGTTVITYGNDNSTVEITGNNRNFVIINGEVWEDGKKVEPSKTPAPEKKILVIQVPQGSNLIVSGNQQFILNAELTLGEVSVDLSGQSEVSLLQVAHISAINLSGQSELSVQKVGTIDRIDISGQSELELTEVTSVTRINLSGQSEIDMPAGTTVISEDVSGQSSIDRH